MINVLHLHTVASASAGRAVQEDGQARSILGRMLNAVTAAVVGSAAVCGAKLTVAVGSLLRPTSDELKVLPRTPT